MAQLTFTASQRSNAFVPYKVNISERWRNGMCECPKVHFYEVEFKLDGMKTVSYHKNCGDPLSEPQFVDFEKQLMKLWGMEAK